MRILRLLMPAILAALVLCVTAVTAAPPFTGAIFTTDSTCTGVNLNIYDSRDAVYLDGGPNSPGAAGLPDGSYYVKVSDPSGANVLGVTSTASVSVSGGEFASCYQLSAILNSASSLFLLAGYDETPNNGGEYKVEISGDPAFPSSSTKSDNFKVKPHSPDDDHTPQATLDVHKFYDANANGTWDSGEVAITGWKVHIQDGISYDRYTPVSIIVDPDDYTVNEFAPIENNWIATTPASVSVHLEDAFHNTIDFGNVCLGGGGGLTLGFWSNKNGQALVGADDLSMLTALNLVGASGAAFDPTTAAGLKTWLLNGTAVNMAYMLSVQLSAMELNVFNGKVSGAALVYGGASLGFLSINSLMAQANAALLANPVTLSDGAARSAQELLKNVLDGANNNLNFVQAAPCAFSFAG